jgi:hypothetical protein
MWVSLAVPFVYTGPSLLMQRTWTPPSPPIGTRRHDFLSVTVPIGSQHLPAGKSCGGTLTASYLSPNYTMRVGGATANGACVFIIAKENVQLGAITFPLDLTPLGLTGCELGVDPLLLVTTVADATGASSVTFPFAVGTLDTAFWSVQALHVTTQNPIGLATTNVVNSIIGSRGLIRQVRVDNRPVKFDDFNSTGPVTLIRGR